MEVPFNVSLFERFYFAGEHVFYVKIDAVLVKDGPSNEIQGQKRGFGTRTHRCDA